jgi:hypothetical protein
MKLVLLFIALFFAIVSSQFLPFGGPVIPYGSATGFGVGLGTAQSPGFYGFPGSATGFGMGVGQATAPGFY